MNAIATLPADNAAAVRTALKTSLYPGATDESVGMVLAYCKAGGLDPLTKPVHLVPMRVKDARGNYSWRDVVMPGIELYRTKAHRTGEYAGQDEPDFGPTAELAGVTFPEWCKVTVYRLIQGQRVPFSARVFWREAYATDKEGGPNTMWRKRPYGQLEKCAEALALRKAFPEAVGAQPTAEEMEGKTLEAQHAQEAPKGPQRVEHKPAQQQELAEDADVIEPEAEAERAPAGVDAETGEAVVDLPDAKLRILNVTLERAGKTIDDLLAGFGCVSESNLNAALAWARS